MTEFKAGDRVRYKSERHMHPTNKEGVGTILRRSSSPERDYWIVEQDGGIDVGYFGHEMTLVEPEPKFKRGDRLRITVEGEFFEDTPEWLGLTGVAVHKNAESVDILNVEKVEPPVETFKQGAFVRHRRFPEDGVVALGRNAYMYLEDGTHHRYGQGLDREDFTSEQYERVTLVEPPL